MTQTTPPTPKFESPEQLAERLSVSYKTVLAHIKTGKLRAIALGKHGGKPYRILDTDADDWFTAITVRPKPQEPSGPVALTVGPRRARRSKPSATAAGEAFTAGGGLRANRPAVAGM